MGDKQQFSLWYFFISLAIILLMQTYLLAPRPEVISYSQFKMLVRRPSVENLDYPSRRRGTGLHAATANQRPLSDDSLGTLGANPRPSGRTRR
jgi:hypothetical protein